LEEERDGDCDSPIGRLCRVGKVLDAAVAVDWDGTCKDTMGVKWRQGFNLALPRIWPALAPYQREIDEVCYRENLAPGAMSAQRFLMLRKMMGMWKEMGLPVPDLAAFFRAVEDVERRGESHGTANYRRLAERFGYDDSAMRWSDLSDELIARASRAAPIFANCREVLAGLVDRADLLVVCAAKSRGVHQDLVNDRLADLFKALLAQDFLPKKGCLAGLAKKYDRVIFVADGKGDMDAAAAAGVSSFEIRIGDEAASWLDAKDVLRRFVDGT
jgi:phosphoglycolate phosphatase-like HAD superfamily hydrolase